MVSTVTAFSDMAPSPRVVIDVDDADLNPLCVTAQVIQVSKWGSVPVEVTPRTVAGGFVVYDYTAPGGVPLTYQVRQYAADGTDLGLALAMSASLEWDPGSVVVSDPFAPASVAMLTAELGTAANISRSRPTAIYQAGSRSFAMSGLITGFQQVPLRVITETESQRATLSTILESSVILVRSMPELRLPGSFYATVASLSMLPWDAVDGGDTDVWDLAASEVSRPSIDVLVPVYSYDLFKAYLDAKYPPVATYADAAAEWSTYIDAIRNPPSAV